MILERRDDVAFSRGAVNILRASGDQTRVAIAEVIDRSIAAGRRDEGKPYQIFLLSAPGEQPTLMLPRKIRHSKKGAWTQGQRYTSSEALGRGPATTEDLEAEGG
jgi:hypothetical protein